VNADESCQPRRRSLGGEFHRYFWAGGLAFGCDLAVLVLLTEAAGFNYLVANLFAFGAGFAVNYFLCIHWVFARRRFRARAPELAVFVLVALVGIMLNEAVLWLAVAWALLHYTVAKVIATGVVFALNFLMRKAFLFR